MNDSNARKKSSQKPKDVNPNAPEDVNQNTPEDLDFNPNAPEDFETEISVLVDQLNEALGGGKSRWHYDEPSETLFIELEAILNTGSEEVEAVAGPYLDATELDFEEIILLPLVK